MWDPEAVQPSLGRLGNDLPGREMAESRGGAHRAPRAIQEVVPAFPIRVMFQADGWMGG